MVRAVQAAYRFTVVEGSLASQRPMSDNFHSLLPSRARQVRAADIMLSGRAAVPAGLFPVSGIRTKTRLPLRCNFRVRLLRLGNESQCPSAPPQENLTNQFLSPWPISVRHGGSKKPFNEVPRLNCSAVVMPGSSFSRFAVICSGDPARSGAVFTTVATPTFIATTPTRTAKSAARGTVKESHK